jgi:hypothetical protein
VKPRIKCLGIAESSNGKLKRAWSCVGGGVIGKGFAPADAYYNWHDGALRCGLIKTRINRFRPFGVTRV